MQKFIHYVQEKMTNETKISLERSEENDNEKYTETVSRLQKAW